MPPDDLSDPRLFFNRHLSWMQFNERVLEEARSSANPLLERVKFLAITASNLDEFVEIRVAGLLQQAEQGHDEPGPDGRSPSAALAELAKKMAEFADAQYSCWRGDLVPALADESVHLLSVDELEATQKEYVEKFFSNAVEPLLTPVTVDPAHPFPHVLNKALCLAFLLRPKRKRAETYLGVLTVPRALPRLVLLPSNEGKIEYVFLHDVVRAFSEKLYRGYEIVSAAAFRVTRNSNLYLEEEESRTLLDTVDTQLHRRRKGAAVRLEIEAAANEEIVSRLQTKFRLAAWQVFRVDGPVNLSRLFHIYDETPRPDLKFKPFVPREIARKPGTSIFQLIRKQDLLLHHPYDSYSTVVDFIETASQDPDVLSIKQTLYRTSENSPIVRALIQAAAKKEVAVVVELKARFDEASNIRWARNLEDAGVQVYFGVVGLKTHCKMALMARREPDGRIRRYAHLGTGNYNPSTARFYTDLSLLSSNTRITLAVQHVFNYLTAYSERPHYQPLFLAPVNLGKNCLSLIERETAHARAGKPAFIVAKVNALLDDRTIQALYRASQAGVRIELLVRGACGLRPGVPGVSSRIRVRSVIGRFLEHSRIFVFGNDGNTEIYLGSADWMHRNIYERVEVMFHLTDPRLRERILLEVIAPYFADTEKTRFLTPDGRYVRARDAEGLAHRRNGWRFNAQQFLIDSVEQQHGVLFPPLPHFLRGAIPKIRKHSQQHEIDGEGDA